MFKLLLSFLIHAVKKVHAFFIHDGAAPQANFAFFIDVDTIILRASTAGHFRVVN